MKHITANMKVNIVKKIALKIKNILSRMKSEKFLTSVSRQNRYNEQFEDIIKENLYNERLEAALAVAVAQSPSCAPQTLNFILEEGVSISLHSGCQAAQPQIS